MAAPPVITGRTGGHPEIHTVTLPLLFPLFPTNVYFIDGKCPTLIDTGIALEVAWQRLAAWISSLGFSIKDIKRVILTHGHIDHVGLVGRLREEGAGEVFIHEGDAGRISSDVEGLVMPLEQNAARLVKLGIRKKDVDRLLRTYVSIVRRFSVRFAGARPLPDGSSIEFSGFSLQVVHTPGHSAGSVCLFERTSRLLLSGDHVMEGTSTNPLIEMATESATGLGPYLASLDKVRRLAPARVLAGHGDPIEDPVRHIEGIVSYHERLRSSIAGALGAEWTTPIQLAGRLFPDIEGIYASNVVFEVYSHLLELVEGGKAALEEREAGYYFRAGERPPNE